MIKTEPKLVNTPEEAQEILGENFVIKNINDEVISFKDVKSIYNYKISHESLELSYENSSNWLKKDFARFKSLETAIIVMEEYNKFTNQNLVFVDLLGVPYKESKIKFYNTFTKEEGIRTIQGFKHKLKSKNKTSNSNDFFTFDVQNKEKVKVPQSEVNNKFLTVMEKTGLSVEIVDRNESILDLMFEKAVSDYIKTKGFNASYDKFVEVLTKNNIK